MLFSTLYALALGALATSVAAQHGASEEGKMGPVAFLWPEDRAWNADHDNTARCGSVAGVTVRTDFPLGALLPSPLPNHTPLTAPLPAGGAVALTIDDESWDVKIALSLSNAPTKQSDFDAAISTIAAVDAGHQCYKLPTLPVDITEGANATIQLQYTSLEDDGDKDTFYACADVTFVATRTFTETIPCFNVTSDEFVDVTDATSTAATAAAATAAATTAPASGAGFQTVGSFAAVAVAAVMFGMLLN